MHFLTPALSLVLLASLASSAYMGGIPDHSGIGDGNVEASSAIGSLSSENVISQNIGKAVGLGPNKGIKSSNLLGTETIKNVVNQNINAGGLTSVASLKASNSITSKSSNNLVNQNVNKQKKMDWPTHYSAADGDMVLTDIASVNDMHDIHPKPTEAALVMLDMPEMEAAGGDVEAVNIIGIDSNKNFISQNIGVKGSGLKDLKASSAVDDHANANVVSQNVNSKKH